MKDKLPFNIIIVIFIAFALIGLYWLDRLGLDAGSAYLWLFIIGFIFIAISTIVYLSGKADFWYEIPINKSTEQGLLVFIIGIGLLIVLTAFSSLSGLQFYSPFMIAPLAPFSLSIGAETFSALQAATSPFWTFFITVFSASTIEEIVLGWGFVVMGSLILGFGLRSLLKLDFGDSGGEHSGNAIFDFIMAMLFSVIMFTVLHFFNKTYLLPGGGWNWAMFGYAAIFRLILNILIYKFGNFGLLFSIGVHAANNMIYLGKETIFAALTSFPGGLILDALIILLVFFGIVSIKKMIKEGEMLAKDFIDFD
jgi:membrane protease YdiL (CAAX protease family)